MKYENDEFFDEFYATDDTCPRCNENACDEFMPMCGSCSLEELATYHSNEDAALEMSLGLDY